MAKKSNLFYWYYIGYGHRRKYVCPLHALNKNENFIKSVLAGAFGLVLDIQKLVPAKPKKLLIREK